MFNVVSVNDDSYTLVKDRPLLMEDIKKYGGDEIYSFSTLYENTLMTNSLYNSDDLRQIPYYKSSDCNMDSGEFINSGCNLDYKSSF